MDELLGKFDREVKENESRQKELIQATEQLQKAKSKILENLEED